MYQRNTEALERRRERQQREDSAARLTDEVPNLRTLRLVMNYRRGAVEVQPGHTRVVVVQRAPALFAVTCPEKECKSGGFDFTADVMRALKAGETAFKGTTTCEGVLGAEGARCGCEIHYEADATYG